LLNPGGPIMTVDEAAVYIRNNVDIVEV